MTDPERFDGNDGLTLGYLSDLVGMDYRAALAELAAQVRYFADELRDGDWDVGADEVAERLYALVGKWPHEGDVGAFDSRSEWEPKP